MYAVARAASLELWLSTGVVGSSASFCALGIRELREEMGGCSSDTVSLAVRLVMLAALASTARGREKVLDVEERRT